MKLDIKKIKSIYPDVENHIIYLEFIGGKKGKLFIPIKLNFFKEYDKLKNQVYCSIPSIKKKKNKFKYPRLLKCIDTDEIGKASYFADKLNIFPSSFWRSINTTGKCKSLRFIVL